MTNTDQQTTRGLSGKIATLERRLDYLKRKLEQLAYATTSSADFDRAEIAALETAIASLEHEKAPR